MCTGTKGIPLREERSGDRRFAEHALPRACQQEPRQAWMRGQPRQFLPELRHAIASGRGAWFDRTELVQEAAGVFETVGRGLVEPGKVSVFTDSEQVENRGCEVAAKCLGGVGPRTVVVRGLVPEPPTDAGTGTAGPPRPLIGGGLRDRDQLQSGQPCGGRDAELPRQPRVDHSGDAGDRERGFGDVRGEDDLAAAHVGEHAVLLLRRHVAKEREHRVPLTVGGGSKFSLAPHDLTDARQEDEHMTCRRAEGLGHRGGDKVDLIPLLATAGKPHVNREDPALGGDDRAHAGHAGHAIHAIHAAQAAGLIGRAQQAGHRLRGERRAHHDDAEVGAKRLTQADKQAEHQIHLDGALVKLVEHDRRDAIEPDITQ